LKQAVVRKRITAYHIDEFWRRERRLRMNPVHCHLCANVNTIIELVAVEAYQRQLLGQSGLGYDQLAAGFDDLRLEYLNVSSACNPRIELLRVEGE
jgi:hypothetical protein